MNVRYLHRDTVLWAPAEHTDAVFRSLVEMYERRHEITSGLDWGPDDHAHVDPDALQPFAQAVIREWETIGSTVFHQLADGFVAALQVLAERCGVTVDVGDDAYALAAAMRHNM